MGTRAKRGTSTRNVREEVMRPAGREGSCEKSRRRRGGCSVWRWGRATSSDDEMQQTAVRLAVHAASHIDSRCRPLTSLFIAHSSEGYARAGGFELRLLSDDEIRRHQART